MVARRQNSHGLVSTSLPLIALRAITSKAFGKSVIVNDCCTGGLMVPA